MSLITAPQGIDQTLWNQLQREWHWTIFVSGIEAARTSTFQQACIALYGIANTLADSFKDSATYNGDIYIANLGNNPNPIHLPVALRIGHELEWFDLAHEFDGPWNVYMGQGDEPFDSFKEAFVRLFNWTKETIKGKCMALQILETGIWIADSCAPINPPIFWYDAKDIACELAWVINAELVSV